MPYFSRMAIRLAAALFGIGPGRVADVVVAAHHHHVAGIQRALCLDAFHMLVKTLQHRLHQGCFTAAAVERSGG